MMNSLSGRAPLAAAWMALAVLPATGLAAGQEAGQDVRIDRSAVTLSSGSGGRAALELTLADDTEHVIAFADGAISLDGDRVGGYEPGGALAAAWRSFLRDQAGAEAETLRRGLEELIESLPVLGDELEGAEAESARALGDGIARILGMRREADIDAAQVEAAQVEGPGGTRLSIAPGGVPFDELVGQLDRLRDAIGRLGGAAEGAAERLALIVHDDFTVAPDDVVGGNLALLDGTLRLEGRVSGDVLVLAGDLVLSDDARVDGNILQVGGDVTLSETARVTGEILSDFPSTSATATTGGTAETPGAEAEAEPPSFETRARARREAEDRGFFSRIAHNLGHATEELMSALSAFIILGVLGLLLVYFARPRLETVADTVRHEFARSFAMGLAGEVLFFPALLILLVLVITWPVVPFFVLATGLAMVVGYLAVAHGAGEMFAQRRYRYEWLERLRRSNSYYYVLSGLVLLLLPFAAAAILWIGGGTVDFFRGLLTFVACVGTWILMTAGFGAVLLTRVGSRSVVVNWHGEAAPVDPLVDTEPAAGGPAGTARPAEERTGSAETGSGPTAHDEPAHNEPAHGEPARPEHEPPTGETAESETEDGDERPPHA